MQSSVNFSQHSELECVGIWTCVLNYTL